MIATRLPAQGAHSSKTIDECGDDLLKHGCCHVGRRFANRSRVRSHAATWFDNSKACINKAIIKKNVLGRIIIQSLPNTLTQKNE